MFSLLNIIWNQAHGVSIKKICDDLNKTTSSVIGLIGSLSDLGLIKQDSRSITAGLAWDSTEAIYYTIKERRQTIDIVVSKKEDSLVYRKISFYSKGYKRYL